jgi:hypothetical protein
MTTKAISLPDGMLPADAVMGKEIQFVATTIACKRAVLMVESSQRADPMVRARWGSLTPIAPDMTIPMQHCFMPKSSGELGMEIVDFIVNAAGSQTRRYMRESSGHALDFADVFLRLPTVGCRFSLIRGVKRGATGEIVGLDHLRLIDRNDVDVQLSIH